MTPTTMGQGRTVGAPGRGRAARAAALLALGAVGLAAQGCYERVISARGVGSQTIQTQEPYQESGELDRWIFGDEPRAKYERRARE